MPPVPMQFVKSAQRVEDLPATDREVAVVGRSNVGKSSLINAFANRNQLARVSKTPGRTQLINLFEVSPGVTVVDLPGYGYAKVPGRIRGEWGGMIEGYLLRRDGLQMVMVLVDGEVGPTKLDVQMLDWLRQHEIPHQVIATKSDKVKSGKKPSRKKELAAGCLLDPGDIVWVSASKNINIDRLQDLIRSWLSP
ncbi:MAG: ribosome biogenesis GTP-binding protein YihA/YsxC [Ilumatobacteraceae bacterium]